MPTRESDVALAHLDEHAERSWTVWGPCSGGVRVVYFCDGRVYTYFGGDARPADSGRIVEQTVDEFVHESGEAEVTSWLRAHARP